MVDSLLEVKTVHIFADIFQTPVSLTPYAVLKDPSIFEEPDSFLPQRWLEAGPDGVLKLHKKLDRYFVAFSKGSRMCPGIK